MIEQCDLRDLSSKLKGFDCDWLLQGKWHRRGCDGCQPQQILGQGCRPVVPIPAWRGECVPRNAIDYVASFFWVFKVAY